MVWVLYVIVGIVLTVFLWIIGFIPELLAMCAMTLIAASLSGGISALCGLEFAEEFHIGVMIGLLLYGIYCLARLVDHNYSIAIFSDCSKHGEKEYESINCIMGLVMMLACAVYYMVTFLESLSTCHGMAQMSQKQTKRKRYDSIEEQNPETRVIEE